jgi:hypothetical protein
MRLREFVYVFCLLLFVAHSYTEDKHVPLRFWHKHVFSGYCTISVLNRALMGMMVKLNYKLRVQPRELRVRLEFIRRRHDSLFVSAAAESLEKGFACAEDGEEEDYFGPVDSSRGMLSGQCQVAAAA